MANPPSNPSQINPTSQIPASSNSAIPPPTDQSGRVIFFRLVDVGTNSCVNTRPIKAGVTVGVAIAPTGNAMEGGHTLTVNPEDLTVTDPSRVSVQQTMGNAWVDNFGRGLRTINISGVTGWRALNANGRDWQAELQSLYENAFKCWHQWRENKIQDGQDPDDIKLEFVDTLDKIAAYVVPQQFILKRSKSRPLLIQYNIGMMATADIGYNFSKYDPIKSPDPSLALTSFEATMNNLTDMIATGIATVTGAVAVVFKFIAKVMRVLNSVLNLIKAGVSIISSVTSIVKKLVKAAMNMCAMLSAIVNTVRSVSFMWQQMCGAFRNIGCLFAGGLSSVLTLENYAAFNGSSNCSSTTGGSPLSPLNGVNGLALLPTSPAPRLPKPIVAPESLAHKAARQALASARLQAQRDAVAASSAKNVSDTAAQFAIDNPSTANTARAAAKLAAYTTLAATAVTSQQAADAAAITFATTQ